MDKATTAIRLEQWANIFREWSASGLNKTEFCQQRGIKEKLFFYYQRRLRNIVAEQTGASWEGFNDLLNTFPLAKARIYVSIYGD